MIELKNWLFDNDIFFETKIEENCTEICFKLFGTEFFVYFVSHSDMIRMLSISMCQKINTQYSEKIEDILEYVAIYNKTATQCQFKTAVSFT